MAQVNLDTASRLDVICRRGDTFSLGIDFGVPMPTHSAPDDLYTMEVRTSADNTGTAFFSGFSFERTDGDDTNSKITISATSTGMELASGTYVYDLQHESTTSGVKTYLYGKFTINDDITI
tara:strand:+ start:11404 stop:11766 length:363 start_codon:yes stop_codon:yes gene_type:complete